MLKHIPDGNKLLYTLYKQLENISEDNIDSIANYVVNDVFLVNFFLFHSERYFSHRYEKIELFKELMLKISILGFDNEQFREAWKDVLYCPDYYKNISFKYYYSEVDYINICLIAIDIYFKKRVDIQFSEPLKDIKKIIKKDNVDQLLDYVMKNGTKLSYTGFIKKEFVYIDIFNTILSYNAIKCFKWYLLSGFDYEIKYKLISKITNNYEIFRILEQEIILKKHSETELNEFYKGIIRSCIDEDINYDLLEYCLKNHELKMFGLCQANSSENEKLFRMILDKCEKITTPHLLYFLSICLHSNKFDLDNTQKAYLYNNLELIPNKNKTVSNDNESISFEELTKYIHPSIEVVKECFRCSISYNVLKHFINVFGFETIKKECKNEFIEIVKNDFEHIFYNKKLYNLLVELLKGEQIDIKSIRMTNEWVVLNSFKKYNKDSFKDYVKETIKEHNEKIINEFISKL